MSAATPSRFPVRGRHRGAALLLACLPAFAACVRGQLKPGGLPESGRIQVTASFHGLELQASWYGSCGAPGACTESIRVDRRGAIEHVHQGQRWSGELPEEDLTALADLATSDAVVAEMRAETGCQPPLHFQEWIEVSLTPNLWVGSGNACFEGAVATLVDRLRTTTKQMFPASDTFARDTGGRVPVTRAQIDEAMQLTDFSWRRTTTPCASEAGCFEEISVDDESEGVGVRLVKPRSLERWKPVTDLSPLSEVAIRPAVIAELRRPEGCKPIAGGAETLSVGVAPRLWLRGEIAGCTSAAMADLRAAARALVDRLAAAPDAGDTREPFDGLR